MDMSEKMPKEDNLIMLNNAEKDPSEEYTAMSASLFANFE